MTVARKRIPAPMANWWPRLRALGGVLVLAGLIGGLGTGPFLAGIASLDVAAVLAALAIGGVTTVCSAWRWRVVAGRLGVGLPLRSAVAAYYGSQFLNSTLPGGVLGDVHRAVRHGRSTGDLGLGTRSVVWERMAGPVVHVGLTLPLLLILPVSWAPSAAVWIVLFLVAGGLGGLSVVVVGRWPRGRRLVAAAITDLRTGLLARAAWPQVLIASVAVAVGHAATFVLAARITGAPASVAHLLPVAMVVLAAMLVPLNIGGWGPREGIAAGLFAAAGWGAASGVAAATAFGVLSLIATLPGLVVLAVRPLATRSTSARVESACVEEVRPVA